MTDIALVVLVALSLGMVILAEAVEGTPQVVIDAYTVDSTLTSPATLQLGRTALLVCRVSGIPHEQQTSYQWTCPNQPCVQTGYAGRKIDNNIIAINTTSTSDGGTYTCTVTAGGMEGRQLFRIRVTGGEAVHSFGRLIPLEGIISTASQLQPPNTASGDGRIECTVSSGTADFDYSVNDVLNGTTATYNIPAGDFNNFQNKEGVCGSDNTYHYLFISRSQLPRVLVREGGETGVRISVNFKHFLNGINRVIVGYDRLDLGLPMVGQYKNNEQQPSVTFTSLVPGARYRITVWGTTLGRSISTGPTVVERTTAPSVPSPPRALTITRDFEDGIELNWLPPRETNGDIQHYIIRYTLQNRTAQGLEINTTNNINYYYLAGLEGGQTYYNFTVKAVNLAHTSAQSNTVDNYTLAQHSAPTQITDTTEVIIGATTVIFLSLLLLSITILVISGVLIVKNRKKHTHYNNNRTLAEDDESESRYKIVNGSTPVGDKAVADVEDNYLAIVETMSYQDLDPNTVDYENIYTAPQNTDQANQNPEWGETGNQSDMYEGLDDVKTLDDGHPFTAQNTNCTQLNLKRAAESNDRSNPYEGIKESTLNCEHTYTTRSSASQWDSELVKTVGENNKEDFSRSYEVYYI